MTTRLSRRAFAATALGGIASLAREPLALGRPAFLAADGTPVSGEAVVYTARRPLEPGSPSGDQIFQMAGPVVSPATLDPALVRELQTSFVTRMLFRGLIVFDVDLNPVLELAERAEVSADGLTYTFTLDPRAVFLDGKTITSADVVFSLTRSVDPVTAGGQSGLLSGPTFLSSVAGFDDIVAGNARDLAGVTAIDDATVQIRLSRPDAAFLLKLASTATSVVDSNDVARAADWWRAPNSSGPFQVSEFVDNDHLTLAPVDTFVDGRPTLESVTVFLGPNAFTPFNLFQAGSVEISPIDIDSLDRVTDPNSEFADQLVSSPLFATEYITFGRNMPPMDDINVRRAVIQSFPAHKIADVTFGGHVVVAEGVVPDGMLGATFPVQAIAYDPVAASASFAESTYASESSPPALQIFSTGNPAVAALKDSVESTIGLLVEAIVVQSDEFFTGLALREYPAYALYWGADFPDPATFLESLFGSSSSDNYLGYSNPEFDELLSQAAQEQDPAARAVIYAQAQQVLIDDAVVIPTYHDVGYYLRQSYVKGLQITALGLLQIETIWLER